ncbi:hypothetical protein Bca52824_015246 [Brassica carinata]|uniref:CCHC-type domain-containing protein n=1 Tax=Brassica carinata TaxID=52824 RepID=A0A8X7W4M7_BRACI|nr:hypothetical protein Bca52824_015246 [Brassica carinata]
MYYRALVGSPLNTARDPVRGDLEAAWCSFRQLGFSNISRRFTASNFRSASSVLPWRVGFRALIASYELGLILVPMISSGALGRRERRPVVFRLLPALRAAWQDGCRAGQRSRRCRRRQAVCGDGVTAPAGLSAGQVESRAGQAVHRSALAPGRGGRRRQVGAAGASPARCFRFAAGAVGCGRGAAGRHGAGHQAGARTRPVPPPGRPLADLQAAGVRKAFNSPVMSNLDRFIASKLTHAVTVTSSPAKSLPISSRNRVSQEEMYVDSEAPSLTIQGNGGGSLHIPPQLLALSELEFKKAFLLLTYIPGDPTNSRGFLSARSVTGFLSDVYRPAADRVGKIFMIADDRVQGAVFDLAEDIAKELLENEVPEGNSISLITKLPPLQDDGPSSDNYGRFSSRDRMPRGGGGSRGSRFGGRGGSSRGRDSWGGDDDRRSRSSGGGGSSWSRGGGGGSSGSSDDWLIGGGSDRRSSSSRAPSRERSFGGACFNCGSSGHRAADCPDKRGY